MFSLKTCVTCQKNTRKKAFLFILAMSLLSMVLMGAMYDSQRKNVTVKVFDDFSGVDMVKKATTRQGTVEGLLDELYIGVGENDTVSHELTEAVVDGDTIVVNRGRVISLEYDSVYATAVTTVKKVADVLARAGIAVDGDDIVTPPLESGIKEGDTIRIVRVEKEERKETVTIPFKEVRVEDAALYTDETQVRQEGADGSKEMTYSVTYHDGKEVSCDLVSEEVVTAAADKIVAVGTKMRENTHKGFTYKKKLTVTATAYDPYPPGGSGLGITANGMKAQYGVVAVDPKVIPLGTKLYIESTDDGASWTYGYCIAADTGGAIKGNKIDLCYNTVSECIQFGRKSANVYVLN